MVRPELRSVGFGKPLAVELLANLFHNQGHRTTIRSTRLGRLLQPQNLRFQRGQEDRSDRRGACRLELGHRPWRRHQRRMARVDMQGQVRGRGQAGAHILRFETQTGADDTGKQFCHRGWHGGTKTESQEKAITRCSSSGADRRLNRVVPKPYCKSTQWTKRAVGSITSHFATTRCSAATTWFQRLARTIQHTSTQQLRAGAL